MTSCISNDVTPASKALKQPVGFPMDAKLVYIKIVVVCTKL